MILVIKKTITGSIGVLAAPSNAVDTADVFSHPGEVAEDTDVSFPVHRFPPSARVLPETPGLPALPDLLR